ncbi:MAG: glycosyltransferase [Ferrovibrio sp.]|uniref:glycosyltransferase n=1 Tax=Ferrovibrio sp. TaxID=1917215 RepID=UPI00262374EC|nr:glycosyltransferase [Ferrovibrio sp.]MCW0235871.1 glycosyltransferase [Ferrovibrio sp.]
MRCLWLTLADPEPRHNGQYLYSGGLIDAMGQGGAQMHVLGLARPDSPKRMNGVPGADGIRWWLSDHHPRSSLQSLVSPLPHIADRSWTPGLRQALDARLREGKWDTIVFDGISAGWALDQVLDHFPRRHGRPNLVYVSHNHEASLRREVARNHENFIKRQVLRYDALKAAWLEHRLVDAAALVTAITSEDAEQYLARRPDRRVEVLTPGYAGSHESRRRITAATPRRAVIVGSFDWIAKRMNLEQFVAVADPLFAAHGAELQVIGSAEEAFLSRMRRKAAATQFTGPVDGVLDFMREARIALVAERHGGGFKLKVLDYIFNRMPILALSGSVAGVPLRHDDSILLYEDYESLARGVLQVIDDCDRLNSLQDRAYAACQDQFDWSSRGERLLSAMAAL